MWRYTWLPLLGDLLVGVWNGVVKASRYGVAFYLLYLATLNYNSH